MVDRVARLIAAAQAFLVCVALAACGGGGDEAPSAADQAAQRLAVDVSQVPVASEPSASDAATLEVTRGAEALADTLPGPDRRLVVYTGAGAAARPAHLLTLRPDGSGALVHGATRADIRWVKDRADLNITLPTPIAYEEGATDGSSPALYQRLVKLSGLRYHRVSGTFDRGRVTVHLQADATWLNGPAAGTSVPLSRLDQPGVEMASLRLGWRTPFDAGEMPAGTRWAGLVLSPSGDPSLQRLSPRAQGSFQIRSASNAWLQPARTSASWSVSYGHLLLRDGATVQRYTRLQADPTTGEERWLCTVLEQGVEVAAHDGLAIQVDPALRYAPDKVPGDWRSWVSAGGSGNDIRIRLQPDRTGGLYNFQAHTPLQYAIDAWSIEQDGRELLMKSDLSAAWGSRYVLHRRWVLLHRVGATQYVLETLEQRTSSGVFPVSQGRVNRYVDQGLPLH